MDNHDESSNLDFQTMLAALNKMQAVIWFEPDGTIIEANEIFCQTMGYQMEEIVGKHHRMFVAGDFAQSEDYRAFWNKLNQGTFSKGQFVRRAKDGSEVHLDAVYQPVCDERGTVTKVVKLARNDTDQSQMRADMQSRIDAISNSHAIVEFDLDGKILSANDYFLLVSGYTEGELVGQNHRMLLDRASENAPMETELWRKLRRGEHETAEFARVGKNGRQLWLQSTYNPIFDRNGKAIKVIQFATDITEQKTRTLALIEGVTEVAASITREVNTITDTAGDLAKRSENQAATVEETSAAMEEISATVTSNVSSAQKATEQARSARDQAKKGSDVVENAISAMEKIEGGSKEIRKFIEVIDSIAFQTNLLALNAGVEAARAGDAGRGFAVVASEVRALAQRASDSAKDINALIDTNAREVSEGAALVNETGSVLREITEGVSSVTEGIEDIFSASQEQATGLGEINAAISEVDKATQLNVTMAQESSATAATLLQNTRELQALLGHTASDSGKERQRPPAQARRSPEPSHSAPPASMQKIAVNQTQAQTENDDDWKAF